VAWEETTGARVRRYREKAALSIRELAEIAELAPASIWNIETGRHKARPSSIRKLAKALQVRPDELVGT